jgi:hypothetical protein
MSTEAESPMSEDVALQPFDVLPEAERRQLLLKQWADRFEEHGPTIIIVRSIAENPLSFQMSDVFPELASRSGKLHRRWADCQLASDSVHWSPRLGRHLVCLIPAGGRWFAGLDTNVNVVVVGDGYKHPIACLEELRVNLVILVGIYAGRVLEARRHRSPAQEQPESEREVTEPEPKTPEGTSETTEGARDPPD